MNTNDDGERRRRTVRRTTITAALVTIAIVLSLPAVAGRGSNPPVVAEPAWDSPTTRDLAVRACFDCHSNETRWPWYARVAPMSWLVQRDVVEGREVLNFSEWGTGRRQGSGAEAVEEVLEGEMPMPIYLPLHAEARLSASERATLAAGLRRTLGPGTGDRDDD